MITALSDGLLVTVIAVARRTGVEMTDAGPGHVCGGIQSDVQIPDHLRTASTAVVAAALGTRAR